MACVTSSTNAESAELRRLSTLYDLLAVLARAKTLDDVYNATITSLLAGTEAERAAILLFDAEGEIHFHAWQDVSPEFRESLIGHNPWPRGTHDAKPVIVPNIVADESMNTDRHGLVREGIRAFAFLPLEVDQGVVGSIALCYSQPHHCTCEELEIAQVIAGHVALAIAHERAEFALAESERRRQEIDRKKLEAASVQLAAIVESSDDAIISKDLNGIVTSWNKGAERIFGYTEEEMIGKPIATLAAPEVIDEMPNILEKIRRGERVHHYETRRRRKDGEIIDVSLTISPVRDATGRIIGASKIARDITDRKRIESERASLLAREHEARKTAELLNRVGPLLATELSVSKLVQSVTDIATELVGAEFGSFLHNVINEQGESYMLQTLSGVSRAAFQKCPMPRNTELFAPTFRGEGVVRSDDITRDPRFGENAPYYGMHERHLPVRSYLAAPVVSRSGEVFGGLFLGHSKPGVFREQHESLLTGIAAQAAIAMDNARLFEQAQRAQDELKRSNEDLRRANQDLETFAYSASHDLQEPLRTIVITTQFLGKRYREHLPANAVPLLESVVAAAQRMESLIRDVLAYATASKQEKAPAPVVDPNQVLISVLKDLAVAVKDTGATITSEPLPPVRTHHNRLAQLLQNLISNGLKYRREETPRIHVSAVERDGWVVFSVRDNGIGIDPDFTEQIFGLFKRLHSHDEYPGSGIGLAICQRIVEQYGGRIWLESSTPDKGSTFSFTLPSANRPAQENSR